MEYIVISLSISKLYQHGINRKQSSQCINYYFIGLQYCSTTQVHKDYSIHLPCMYACHTFLLNILTLLFVQSRPFHTPWPVNLDPLCRQIYLLFRLVIQKPDLSGLPCYSSFSLDDPLKGLAFLRPSNRLYVIFCLLSSMQSSCLPYINQRILPSQLVQLTSMSSVYNHILPSSAQAPAKLG